MKCYDKTLLQLDHKLYLSQVRATSHCYAARFHGTKGYAKQAVANHRAMSSEIREGVAYLLSQLDCFDKWVEEAHANVVALILNHEDDKQQGEEID